MQPRAMGDGKGLLRKRLCVIGNKTGHALSVPKKVKQLSYNSFISYVYLINKGNVNS